MSLELIIGPMFAGKTAALQSVVRRRQSIGWDVLVIKHDIDTRYLSEKNINNMVVNHDQQQCPAKSSARLLDCFGWTEYKSAQLIVVEEGQFFGDLLEFVLQAVEKDGKDVVVVGLDGDAHRKPFGKILDLIPLADNVHRLFALCKMCGDGTPARFTSANSMAVSEATCDGKPNVGSSESYRPLCRKHWLQCANT